MPKRYEEEINEILHKFDDWPPSGGRGQAPTPPRRNTPTAFEQFFSSFSAYKLMLLGLLLVLLGLGAHVLGAGLTGSVGSYATAAGALMLLVGYALAVTNSRRGGARVPRQKMWRGEVIDLPPRGRGLDYWWWRFTANFRRRR